MSIEVLSQIKDSRWAKRPSGKILEYYQNPARLPKRYGLYTSSLDRFILVDGLDLWVVEHTAKLLSSKFLTTICVFTNEEPPFEVDDCLLWSFIDKTQVLPKMQNPEIFLISGNHELIQEGLPYDFIDRMDEVIKDQEFAHFVLRATYAMKLTELYLNSNAELYNFDQNFYTSFYAQESLDVQKLTPTDKAQWAAGFTHTLSSLLYKAQSTEEASDSILRLRNANNFNPAEPLHKQFYYRRHERSFLFKQVYLGKFFELLEWKPEEC